MSGDAVSPPDVASHPPVRYVGLTVNDDEHRNFLLQLGLRLVQFWQGRHEAWTMDSWVLRHRRRVAQRTRVHPILQAKLTGAKLSSLLMAGGGETNQF
jgi:hypothetical protein